MKGALVAKPLLFSLEIAGEDFCQGDKLSSTLSVTNSSSFVLEPTPITLDLCCADLKKLKARNAAALTLVQSSGGHTFPCLAPQNAERFNFNFSLDKNCPITDRADTLCFQYGSPAVANGLTQLPITIKPHRHIQAIVEIFESPFQFQFKSSRSKAGWVEYKLKPPSSRDLAQIDELTIAFCFDGDALKLRYEFKIKSFDTSNTQGKIKKTTSALEQELALKDYLLTEQHLNNAVIEAKIAQALHGVSSGI